MRPRTRPSRSRPAGVHYVRAIRDVDAFRAEFLPGAPAGGDRRRLCRAGDGRNRRARSVSMSPCWKARRAFFSASCPRRVRLSQTSPPRGRPHRARRPRRGHRGGRPRHGRAAPERRVFPSDIVLVAVGGVPNVELAEQPALLSPMASSSTRPCAPARPDLRRRRRREPPSRLYGRRIRLNPCRTPSIRASRRRPPWSAGPSAHDPVPWFWSDQYDVKLQIAGLSEGHDETFSTATRLRVFQRRISPGRPALAVDSLNSPRSHMTARRAIPASLAEAA